MCDAIDTSREILQALPVHVTLRVIARDEQVLAEDVLRVRLRGDDKTGVEGLLIQASFGIPFG